MIRVEDREYSHASGMRKLAEKVAAVHGKVSRVLLGLAGGTLLFITVYLSADVIARYVFNHPLPASFSITRMLLVAMAFLGFGYVQATRGNIELEFLTKHFSRFWQGVIEIVCPLLGLLIFGVTVWGAWGWSVRSWVHKEFVEDVIPFPTWPSRFVFFAGTLFLCITYVIDIVKRVHRSVATTRNRKESEGRE